ncbi:MAG: hypothetical protein QOK04_2670, partial [Solirubrobacteraceae bacterium]|nr:hypothetical protein [Solirubrobacteraceae bacterium]
GCGETTAARLTAEPGAAQRELRAWDDEHYVERPGPLSLGKVQALPVPGYCAVGERELELVPADGHTADGVAIWAPWARVLACGDYLSPVEIPMLSAGGGLDAYVATLERLRPLAEQAVAVVPGHGAATDAAGALRLLEEDRAYLDTLAREGESAQLPAQRATAAQRRIHAENAARVTSSWS